MAIMLKNGEVKRMRDENETGDWEIGDLGSMTEMGH